MPEELQESNTDSTALRTLLDKDKWRLCWRLLKKATINGATDDSDDALPSVPSHIFLGSAKHLLKARTQLNTSYFHIQILIVRFSAAAFGLSMYIQCTKCRLRAAPTYRMKSAQARKQSLFTLCSCARHVHAKTSPAPDTARARRSSPASRRCLWAVQSRIWFANHVQVVNATHNPATRIVLT